MYMSEIRSLLYNTSKTIKNKVHTIDCKSICCPEDCDCQSIRRYPLDLHTGMVWEMGIDIMELAFSIESEPTLIKRNTEENIKLIRKKYSIHSNVLKYHSKKYESTICILDAIENIVESAGYLIFHNSNYNESVSIDRINRNIKYLEECENMGGKSWFWSIWF